MKTIQELVAEFSEMFPCISNKCDNNGTLTVEDCDGEPMQEPCEYCHRKRFEDQAWLTATLTDIEAECAKEKRELVREILEKGFTDFGYKEDLVSITDIKAIAEKHNIQL